MGEDQYGGDFDLANHPVVGVSWYEAVAFGNWLTKKLGRPVLLPSEAQWEKAARGTDGRRNPWGEYITPDHANYRDTRIGATSAVGIFPKGESQYQVLDASGNVWEWTATVWTNSYENYTPDEGLDSNSIRTLRGGAWNNRGGSVRCASRTDYRPDGRGTDFGIRFVSPGF